MTERTICLVFTGPVPGQEREYHEWYDSRHLSDVSRVPGVVSAQRYDQVDMPGAGGGPPAGCLAVYEIEGEAGAFVDELRSRFGTDEMPSSPALDPASISMTFWKPRAGGAAAG